jgi:ribosomal protein L12E/L44/L45/RPP1/RPP2
MDYLYIAMLLQESGKEINVTNIQKVLTGLDRDAEREKIQFFVSALSVMLSEKTDKEVDQREGKQAVKEADKGVKKEELMYEQLSQLQKRFEHMESAIESMNENLKNLKSKQSSICLVNEKTEDTCQMKNVVQMQEVVMAKKSNPKEETVQMQEAVLVEEKTLKDKEEKFTPVGSQSEESEQWETSHNQPARYVYGIAGKGEQISLGNIGLDGANVYTIPYKEACLVVHDCQAEPYESEDENIVKEWLFTQQEVLDKVSEKFDSVLPMSFDMIIEGKNGSDPEEAAIKWLEKNYDSFMETISKIKNCAEYGIQIILNTGELSENIFETDEKLRKKKEEIDAKPEGIAYMEREMLKDLVKERIEEKADQYFKEFYGMIKKYPDDIVIGKVKKVGGNQQMLMNLSCLVKKDRVAPLGEELEKIENHEAITVRFSGPWAPYSFVTPEKGVTNNGNG